jgi:hypothetical protein
VKSLLSGILLSATLLAAPIVNRDLLNGLEKSFTASLQSSDMEIFGYPTGVYISGVGVVFQSELNLSYAPMVSPFQQVFSPEEKQRTHDKELAHLPILKDRMRQLLLKSSVTLDTLPPGELIVVGVKITHQAWEDRTGFPDQIVMQGVKSKLMDAKLGRAPVDSAIREQ